tara:strand:+ start:3038 stop:3310 length:273 start_codon:yes stop_codon:yes gene_type:complete
MRNITDKIYNDEWCTKSYKTEANAQRAVEKAYNKIKEGYPADYQGKMDSSFAMFTVLLPSGKYKPVVTVGNAFGQEGIYLIHAGFQVIIK